MTEVSTDEMVAKFADLFGPFVCDSSPSPALLLELMLNSYRDIRIRGASLDRDGDGLLLECGSNQHHLISGIADLRNKRDGEIKWDPTRREWLGFTRQIIPASASSDGELDDSGFCLCIFLFFEPVTSPIRSSNVWIWSPQEVLSNTEDFKEDPFVARLLRSTPARVTAFISQAG